MSEQSENKSPSTAITLAQTQAIQASQNMQSLIREAATNKDMDVSKMRELLAMDKEIRREMAEYEARQAFIRVCAAMPTIKKNGTIDFSTSSKPNQKPIRFADWAEVQLVIKPIYEAEGFALHFDSRPLDNGWVEKTAIATHYTGVEFKSSIPLPLDTSGGKQNIQGAGSTASYGERYATKALFNLRFEGSDDDGKLGGMLFIGDEQAAEINRLIEETETNKPAFLEHIGYATVSNIPKDAAPMAMNLLRDKLAKQKAKKATP